MTPITIPREELQEALDALEYHTSQTRPIVNTNEAIAKLKARLAAPEVVGFGKVLGTLGKVVEWPDTSKPPELERPLMHLTGYQLREALEFVAPDGTEEQLESEVCIQHGPARTHDDGTDPEGLYCWLSDYPDEGSFSLEPPYQPTHEQHYATVNSVLLDSTKGMVAGWDQYWGGGRKESDAIEFVTRTNIARAAIDYAEAHTMKLCKLVPIEAPEHVTKAIEAWLDIRAGEDVPIDIPELYKVVVDVAQEIET